jgi:chorismate mutase
LNPDVKLWIGAIERLLKNGCRNVCAVHRGFSLADNGIYRQSPLWEVAIEFRRLLPEVRLICDPSHIAGKKELVFDLAQTAMNLNYDGLMIETHPSPATAKTDSQQQLLPSELFELLNGLQLFDGKEGVSSLDLEILRKRIDEIDSELVNLFSRRMNVVRDIAQIKNKHNISALQMHRWDKVLNDRMMQAERLNINKEFVKEVFEQIHKESLSIQDEIMRKD